MAVVHRNTSASENCSFMAASLPPEQRKCPTNVSADRWIGTKRVLHRRHARPRIHRSTMQRHSRLNLSGPPFGKAHQGAAATVAPPVQYRPNRAAEAHRQQAAVVPAQRKSPPHNSELTESFWPVGGSRRANSIVLRFKRKAKTPGQRFGNTAVEPCRASTGRWQDDSGGR
jgi:hypothetical protein